MFFQYSLVTVAVILLLSFVTFLFIKRIGQDSKKNRLFLSTGTVLAMVCAILAPPLANLLVSGLYFSIFPAVVTAVFVCLSLSLVLFGLIGKQIDRLIEAAGGESAAEDTGDAVNVLAQAAFSELPMADEDKADADLILDQALEFKRLHRYDEAIGAYYRLLKQSTDEELKKWIVIDMCSLYKMTNRVELVHKLFETEHNKLLDSETKEDILRNL